MRKLILGAATTLALASPAMAADLQVLPSLWRGCDDVRVPDRAARCGRGNGSCRFRDRSWFDGLSLWRRRLRSSSKNIRSMLHRARMRTLVPFGATDGAIAIISTAVGRLVG